MRTSRTPLRERFNCRRSRRGLPPPPPVTHSWKRLDRWAEENYPELFDQLGEGCTNNDLNELEHQLDCSLPIEVRESLQVHDGQERGGMPTGIIFGNMLLDCEEIVQEWENWKKVNQEYLDGIYQLQACHTVEGIGRQLFIVIKASPAIVTKSTLEAGFTRSSRLSAGWRYSKGLRTSFLDSLGP